MSFVIGREQSPAVETPLAGSDTKQGGPQYIKLGTPRRSDGHEGGIPSHDEMARALPQPSKSPRRVDKDRIERATRKIQDHDRQGTRRPGGKDGTPAPDETGKGMSIEAHELAHQHCLAPTGKSPAFA